MIFDEILVGCVSNSEWRGSCSNGPGGKERVCQSAPTWKVHRRCLSCRRQPELGEAELWLACLTRLGLRRQGKFIASGPIAEVGTER